MKKLFTKDYMLEHRGCYSIEQLNACSFMKNDEVTLDSIINSEIPLKDKFWFVIKKTGLDKKENQKIAIDVAEMVLPIYDQRYPENKAPREAIEAAKQYLAGHISLSVLIDKSLADYAAASAASASAAASAYAAAYAYAYAAAAYASAAAYAYAADYAASAAAYASAAASAAAYASADIEGKLYEYLKQVCNNL